jgi:hypothetical protein
VSSRGLRANEEGTYNGSKSRGHLPYPLLGPHCVHTRAPPDQSSALGNAIQQQPTQNGPPADPISGGGINPVLEQLCCRGHKGSQGRWPSGTAQYQIQNSRSRSPQSLQLCIHLPPCGQLHPKLSGGLIQTIGQTGPTRWRPKEQVTDSHGRTLKLRPLFLHVLEFDSQHTHYPHVEAVARRGTPKHRLHSRGHYRPKHGKLSDHFSMVEGPQATPTGDRQWRDTAWSPRSIEG